MLPPPGFRDVVLCGAGATSRVFRATSAASGRIVALKRLHRQLARAPEALSRLRRELRALGALRHRAIVPVFDVIRWQGDPTIVMDYVPGRDLKELIAADGPLSIAEAERIARELFDVLHAAHGAGIVHRDVKPQNVRIGEGGQLFLLDFGSARLEASSQLTATGTSVGTPDYMAPELFAGPVYDPRVDLYGAGATIFEALTGRAPQIAGSLSELAFRRTREDAPSVQSLRSDAPCALAQVVDRLLARAPEDRHATAAHAIWSLDHPEEERRFAARRSEHPPCLHCGAAIPPESNLCAACGSDHPFCFSPGHASVNLVAIREPSHLATELVSTFPELVAELPQVAERLAAVASSPQRIVSSIDREEAIAFADRLRASGAECDVEEDPGLLRWKTRGPFLSAVLLILGFTAFWAGLIPLALVPLMLIPAAAAILFERWRAIDRASEGLLSRSTAPIAPSAGRGLVAAAPLLAGAGLLLSLDGMQAILPVELAPALIGGGALTAIAAAAARLVRFRKRRRPACGSAEPGPLDKLRFALSISRRPFAPIRRQVATLLAVAVVALIPAELAVLAVMRAVVPTFWSLWAETDLDLPSPPAAVWEPALASEPPLDEPIPAPELEPEVPPAIDVAVSPAAAQIEEPLLPEWLDAKNGAVLGSILAIDLLLLAFMILRRRRFAQRGRRLLDELELELRAKTPPRSRLPSRALTAADRIAEQRTGDAFLEATKRRAAELAHHLDAEEAAQIAGLARTLAQAEARRERSLLARCILESDADLTLRFELLRLAGKLEAKAAERWAASLPEAEGW